MRVFPVYCPGMRTRHGHQARNYQLPSTKQVNSSTSSCISSRLQIPLKQASQEGCLCVQFRSQENALSILILVCVGVFVWETKTGYLLYK